GDTHNIWIDPKDGNRILVTNDGGMYMTTDHGSTSSRVTLPIGQIYHVAVDNDVPYKIYGNMQDDGTMRGPSNVTEAGPNVPGQGNFGGRGGGGFGGRGGGGQWEHGLGGCESGFTIPDPTNTDIVWATCYGEVVFSIAPSDVQKGLIWAGTNDGKVWYTKDAGKSWNDVTKNITGLPVWGVVSKIEPSHFDAGTAYIAVDFHQMDNRDPWI